MTFRTGHDTVLLWLRLLIRLLLVHRCTRSRRALGLRSRVRTDRVAVMCAPQRLTLCLRMRLVVRTRNRRAIVAGTLLHLRSS